MAREAIISIPDDFPDDTLREISVCREDRRVYATLAIDDPKMEELDPEVRRGAEMLFHAFTNGLAAILIKGACESDQGASQLYALGVFAQRLTQAAREVQSYLSEE